MYQISLIVAMGQRNRVIGRNNDLPWSKPRLHPDMKYFVEKTSGHPVVMGRHTLDSIPKKYLPLDRGRSTIGISRTMANDLPGIYVARSYEEAIEYAKTCEGAEEIFVAGGAEIYALALPSADRIYVTLVDEDPEGDTFFPHHPEISNVVDYRIFPDFEPRLTFQTIDRA